MKILKLIELKLFVYIFSIIFISLPVLHAKSITNVTNQVFDSGITYGIGQANIDDKYLNLISDKDFNTINDKVKQYFNIDIKKVFNIKSICDLAFKNNLELNYEELKKIDLSYLKDLNNLNINENILNDLNTLSPLEFIYKYLNELKAQYPETEQYVNELITLLDNEDLTNLNNFETAREAFLYGLNLMEEYLRNIENYTNENKGISQEEGTDDSSSILGRGIDMLVNIFIHLPVNILESGSMILLQAFLIYIPLVIVNGIISSIILIALCIILLPFLPLVAILYFPIHIIIMLIIPIPFSLLLSLDQNVE